MGKKSDMNHQTHLLKRGGSYYFRCVIPADLLEHYRPRKEIKFSLRTKDRQTAKRFVLEHSLKYDEEFKRVRQDLPVTINVSAPSGPVTYLTDEQIELICNRFKYEALVGDDYKRRQKISADDLEEMVASHQDIERDLKSAAARGDTSVIERDLNFILYLLQLDVDPNTESYKRLAYRFLLTHREVIAALRRRDDGEVVNVAEEVDTAKLLPLPKAIDKKDKLSAPKLADLFDDWKGFGAKRPGSIMDADRVVREFVALVGDKPASDIVRKDILAYRDHLNASGKLQYKTIRKKITMLSAIFGHAMDNEKLASNPAAGIKTPKSNVEEIPRVPYSLDDLKVVFGSKVFAKGWRPPRAASGEAIAWLPLLALFTGARLEELGQLLVADVVQLPGLGWVLNIIDDDGEKRVKTATSRRKVPIHPALIQAGFLRYHAELAKQGQTRLFPDLVADCKGVLTGNFSKWWGRYGHETLGLAKEKVFHSFRHTFKDACREAEVTEEIHDALTGHSGGGVGRQYGGRQFPLSTLVKAMAKVQYPELVVPVVCRGEADDISGTGKLADSEC